MLLFNRNYIKFLQKTHPHYNISYTKNYCPYYIATINPLEAMKAGYWLKCAHTLSHAYGKAKSLKALIFGLPFEPYEQSDVLKKLPNLEIIKRLALYNRCDLAMVTNASKKSTGFLSESTHNFIVVPSFPSMVLPITKNTFSDYLLHLKGKNRQDIRRNLRTFEACGHKITSYRKNKTPFLKDIYYSYLHAYTKAKIKWLSYSKEYFLHFEHFINNAFCMYAVDKNENFLGFIHAIKEKENLHICRLGISPLAYKKDAIFFRLIYGAIEQAINLSCKKLHLGPTSYRLKCRLNAHPVPLINLVVPINPSVKLLLLAYKRLSLPLLDHLNRWKELKGTY